MVWSIVVASQLLYATANPAPEKPLEGIGVPPADAAIFRKVISKSLSKQWAQKGDASPLKFIPSKTNTALESVLKPLGKDAKEVRNVLEKIDQAQGRDGIVDDATYYLFTGFSILYALALGEDYSQAAHVNARLQLRYSLHRDGWETLPEQDKTIAANVAKAIMAFAIIQGSSSNSEQSKRLAKLLLEEFIGTSNEIKVVDDRITISTGTKEVDKTVRIEDFALPEAAGYKRQTFGDRPGLTKESPDYPNKSSINFVLMEPKAAPYTNFKVIWDASKPGGMTGDPAQIPFKRYVGKGARAMMTYGQVKTSNNVFINMIVYNIENGPGSQALVGFYKNAGDVNQIIEDMESVLEKLVVPGARRAPLTTIKELVGKWTTKGASTMGYFSTSTGNLIGASVVDRNVNYSFNADGTYTYSYQGVTGDLGNLKAAEDTDRGAFTIDGDMLILKSSRKPLRKLSLRGVIQTGVSSQVLLLGVVGRDMTSETYYIEKFVKS